MSTTHPRRRLSRRLSKPFTDLSNLLRPHLHSDRGVDSAKATKADRSRRMSGGISSASCPSPPKQAADLITEIDSSLPLPTPDLPRSNDPVSPAYTGATFEELFLTDSRSSGESVGTPPRIGSVVRRRESGGGAGDRRRQSGPMVSGVVGDLFAVADAPAAAPPAAPRRDSWSPLTSMLAPLDEEENSRSASPTPFNNLAVMGEGDFPRSVTPTPAGTPNPNHQPASNSTLEIAMPTERAASPAPLPESPKRPRPSTPFLMETCPTPPSADRTSHDRVRSNLLDSPPTPPRNHARRGGRYSLPESDVEEELDMTLRLETRLSYEEERDYEEVARLVSAGAMRRASQSSASFVSDEYNASAGPSRMYSPELAWPTTPNTHYGFPFPELVSRLLDEPSAPSPPRLSHLRPTSSYGYAPPSPSIMSRKGKAPARTSGVQQARGLRNSESSSTLFTWDLAHLPAPGNPREDPYKVKFKSLFLPTAFLGPTRGSGQFGDQFGPVERKVRVERARRQGSLASKAIRPMSIMGSSRGASEESRPAAARTRGQSLGSWGSEWGPVERSWSRGTNRVGDMKRSFRKSMLSLVGRSEVQEEGRREEELDQWVAVVLK